MTRDWSEIVESLDVFLTEGQGKRHPRIGRAGSPESLDPVLVDYDERMQFWMTVDNNGVCGKCNDITRKRLEENGLIFRDGVTTLDDIRFVSRGWSETAKMMIAKARDTGVPSASTIYSRGLESDVLIFCSQNPNTLVQFSGDWVITWLAIDIYNQMLAKTGWHRRLLHKVPDQLNI
ncbi:MAG: hypothetical protein ACPG9T_16135 [Pseudomonadales bacterium]